METTGTTTTTTTVTGTERERERQEKEETTQVWQTVEEVRLFLITRLIITKIQKLSYRK